MCLAAPGLIEKIDGDMAILDYDGVKKEANVAYVDVKVGDWVVIHAGFAIQKIDEDQARDVYRLLTSKSF